MCAFSAFLCRLFVVRGGNVSLLGIMYLCVAVIVTVVVSSQ